MRSTHLWGTIDLYVLLLYRGLGSWALDLPDIFVLFEALNLFCIVVQECIMANVEDCGQGLEVIVFICWLI